MACRARGSPEDAARILTAGGRLVVYNVAQVLMRVFAELAAPAAADRLGRLRRLTGHPSTRCSQAEAASANGCGWDNATRWGAPGTTRSADPPASSWISRCRSNGQMRSSAAARTVQGTVAPASPGRSSTRVDWSSS